MSLGFASRAIGSRRARAWTCGLALWLYACSGSQGSGEDDAFGRVRSTTDAAIAEDSGTGSAFAGSGSALPSAAAPPAQCGELPVNQMPEDLACVGLYTNVAGKTLAPGVRAFTPAHQLWSDGAQKQRWISLPEGTKIDNTDPDSWQFPIGTKLFKEFSWNGRRVETRVFWKEGDRHWLKGAYRWSADESAATLFAGGEVDVAGHKYYIPSAKECDQCHKGREERALGFELVSLALPQAQGMSLSVLMKEGLLSVAPPSATFAIGDDGTGRAAPALGWLHVNCGVSCHNGNSAAEGYSTGLRLRLPADGIDGRSSANFDAIETTVGVVAETPEWRNRVRIVKGNPRSSLLYMLASTRNPSDPKQQMPPIASRVADSEGVMALDAWIRAMR